MASKALEEKWEQELNQHVAMALGMTVQDVESLPFEIGTNESNDGLAYGHIIRFHPEKCDPEALARVPNLESDSVIIGPIPQSSDRRD